MDLFWKCQWIYFAVRTLGLLPSFMDLFTSIILDDLLNFLFKSQFAQCSILKIKSEIQKKISTEKLEGELEFSTF